MAVTRRKQKSGRKTRKKEFLPFFKTLYAPQEGGSAVTKWGNTYAVSSVAGVLTNRATDKGCGVYTVGTGTPATTAGYPEVGRDGPPGTGTFHSPKNIYSDSQGNIIIQDTTQSSMAVRVRFMNPQGVLTSYLEGRYGYKDDSKSDPNTAGGTGNASTNTMFNFAVDRTTDVIYFMEYAKPALRTLLRTDGKTLSGRDAPSGIGAGLTSRMGSPTSVTAGRKDGDKDVANFNPATIMTIDSRNRRMYVMEFGTAIIRMIDIIDPDSYYVSSLFNLNKAYVGVHSAICDGNGNLYYVVYYSDISAGVNTYSHCIYKLVPPAAGVKSASGTLNSVCLLNANPLPAGSAAPVIFAGSDTVSGSTDSPTGTTARFNRPIGLACDSNNNIYVADSQNNLIRMITPSGAVTTVAGTLASSNDLTNIPSHGDGENTIARFSKPVGITVDPSDVIYVCDSGNGANCAPFSRIRKLTLIPTPAAPTAVTLLTKDTFSMTFSWSGATTGYEPVYSPYFYSMMQISGNASGPVSGGSPVRYDIFPFPATANPLNIPNRWIQNNKVSDTQQQGYYQNNIISIPVASGTTYSNIQLVAYNGTGSTPSTALATPVVIPPALNNYTLLKSGKVGTLGFVNSIASMSQFNVPMGLAYNATSTLTYVADSANNCIRAVDMLGNSSTFFGTAPTPGNTLTSLNAPTAVTFGQSGDFPLFVADSGNNRVLSITAAGVATLVNTSGVPLTGPTSIAVDTTNILYVTSKSQSCIYAINNGVTSVYAGTPGTTGSTDGAPGAALFNAPGGISYDPFMRCIYVADSGNHLIRILNIGLSTVSTLAGLAGASGLANGQGSVVRFNTPTEVITDPETGHLYIVDSKNNAIRKATPAGLTSTFSGGFTGITATPAGTRAPIPYADGTSTPTAFNAITTNVAYNSPYSICFVASGMMFVSDTGNSCIRTISPHPPPTAPTTIYLAAVTPTSATIAWSGDTNATSYAYSITPTEESIVLPTATGSPAIFTGLSPTTKYFLNLVLKNNAGSISARPVPCVTGAVPNSLVLSITNPTTTYGVNGVIATATLNWTGFTGADTLSCRITPKRNASAGTEVINLPANQASPYILGGLTAATQYSITLTAQFTGIPTSSGSTATTANIVQTSSPVVFTSLSSLKAKLSTVIGYFSNNEDTNVPTTPAPLMRTPTGTPATPAAPTLIQYKVKLPCGVTLDSAGNLYATSGTAIIKLTPSPATNQMYMFDTRLANPDPTLVQPNTIGQGSTVVIHAGVSSGRINTPIADSWKYTGGNIRFYSLGGLAYDSNANILYATDTQIHLFYKITYSGTTPTCEVLIGGKNGEAGLVDGVRGTALLYSPKGVCVGPDGAVYIAEYQNTAVRRYFNGTLTKISSNVIDTSLEGIAIAPDGAIFTTSSNGHCIYKLTPSTTTPGSYTTTLFAGTKQVSGGTNTDGTSLTTVKFNTPQGICIDSKYNIFVADTGNYAIRQIIPSTNTTLTVIGKGTGFVDGNSDVAKVQFSDRQQVNFCGLTCDNFGNIYIADQWNGAVRMASIYPVSITSQQLSTYTASAAVQVAARRASSAVQQQASSALKQQASSALIQQASSALIQQASSAVQQGVSSAIQQQASSALEKQASSALIQQASSAVVQRASSAVEQRASSAMKQAASQAQASSALQQTASSSVQQRASSAIQQTASQAQASSALHQSVLSGPVSGKDQVVRRIKTIQTDIAAKTAIVYSSTSTQADKDAAKAAIATGIGNLTTALTDLANASIPIFSIAPAYQDNILQTVVPSPYLESVRLKKVYDAMRKAYIVLDQNGYIVNNIEQPDRRPLVLGEPGRVTTPVIKETDILLSGDVTLSSSISPPWYSYFDTLDRRYFYYNNSTRLGQYEHPFPPPLNQADLIITDTTTNFLPAGWLKLKSTRPNAPYYFNSLSSELLWVHPNPPPNPRTLTAVPDATLFNTHTKYLDPRTNSFFFVNSLTQEGQWNYPDLAFNPGPSAAARASSAVRQQASSAVQQSASSAIRQQASSAVQRAASSALQQTTSSARQQGASSALIQQASSAIRQQASSAVQRAASSALQQSASSARKQGASSALIQQASSAVRQQASSAVQRAASSAIQQTTSSARQQGASSALEQQASSANQLAFTASAALVGQNSIKDTIKNDLISLRGQLTSTMAQITAGTARREQLVIILNQLSAKQSDLIKIGAEIIQINPNYLDADLINIIPDPSLTGTGVKKAFDSLRNGYIYLDSRNTIVPNPTTPYMRSYSNPQSGGANKTRKTKR